MAVERVILVFRTFAVVFSEGRHGRFVRWFLSLGFVLFYDDGRLCFSKH